MSKTRDTGYLANVIQVHDTGVRIMSGSTMLMAVSSSGAVTITGEMSGSDAANALLLSGTGSVGFTTTSSFLAVSSSQQQISSSLLQVSASYISLSGSYTTFSGSASTRITANSSSIQQVSSSQQQISSSQQQISSSLLNVISVFATTGSNSFRADQSITGSLVVSSTITAQTLVVQTVTSSIVYSSGSNIFGSALGDRQTFTGSMNVTGSGTFAGSLTACGRVHGTTTGLSSDFSSGGLIAYSCGTTLKYTQVGFDCIGNYGWIQPLHQGTSYSNLAINPVGGCVGIRTAPPAELLEVSGSLKIGNLKIQNSDGGRIGFNRNTATGAIYNCCYAAFQINGAYSNTNYLDFQNYNSSGSYVGGFVLNNGNVGICTSSPATLLANTSVRPANADGLSIHLYGLDWAVNGQGYAATIWNTSAAAANANAGLLVRICSTDATDKILDLESGGVNRFRMLGTGAATLNGNVTITNNNWLNFTDSTATARNILTLAGNDNLYLQYKAGCNFYLRNTDGDLRLTIASTGIACFACQICVKEAVYINGSFPGVKLDRSGTSAQSDINWKDAGTSVWSIGTAVRAVGSSLDFYSYCTGDNVFKLTQTGITCFSNTVCAPTFAGSTVRSTSNLDLNGNSGYLTLRTGDTTRLFVGSTGGVSVGAVTDPGLYNFIVAGTVSVNGVITKSIGGTMAGNTATYFDFPTYDDAGNGQMLEVKAFFDHYYNFDYGTHLYRFITSRDTSQCNLTMFNCTSVNGGSWLAYKTSSTNLRVCKIAGTYAGGGAYWIQVIGKQP